MKTVLPVVMINVGIVLLIFGLSVMNSTSSELWSFRTEAPTEKATWLLIGGVVATVIGGMGLLPIWWRGD